MLYNLMNSIIFKSDIIQGYELRKDFKRMGYCRAVTLDKIISTRNNGIALRKNSPYTSVINRRWVNLTVTTNYMIIKFSHEQSKWFFFQRFRILLLRQSGLPQNLETKYKLTTGRCSINELLTSNVRYTSIQLHQFWVVFLIPIVGFTGGFVALLGEIIYFNCKQQQKSLHQRWMAPVLRTIIINNDEIQQYFVLKYSRTAGIIITLATDGCDTGYTFKLSFKEESFASLTVGSQCRSLCWIASEIFMHSRTKALRFHRNLPMTLNPIVLPIALINYCKYVEILRTDRCAQIYCRWT